MSDDVRHRTKKRPLKFAEYVPIGDFLLTYHAYLSWHQTHEVAFFKLRFQDPTQQHVGKLLTMRAVQARSRCPTSQTTIGAYQLWPPRTAQSTSMIEHYPIPSLSWSKVRRLPAIHSFSQLKHGPLFKERGSEESTRGAGNFTLGSKSFLASGRPHQLASRSRIAGPGEVAITCQSHSLCR